MDAGECRVIRTRAVARTFRTRFALAGQHLNLIAEKYLQVSMFTGVTRTVIFCLLHTPAYISN